MKSESILNAFGKISDELIADADITQRSKKGIFPWKAVFATAACLCLILTAAFAITRLFPNKNIGPAPNPTKSPAVMESAPVATKPPATTATAPVATKPPATTATAPVATKPPATTASAPVATKPPVTTATAPVATKPPVTTASAPVTTKPPVTTATAPVATKPPVTTATAPVAAKPPATTASAPVATKPPATTATAPVATKPPVTTATAPVAAKPPATTATAPVATKPPVTTATAPVATKPPATTASVPVPTKAPITIVTVPPVTRPPATEPPGIVDPPSENKLNYGQVLYLSVDNKTDTGITGLAFQHIDGTSNPKNKTTSAKPPSFGFSTSQINVVAKAVEELGVYETFHEYGSTETEKYRLFLMEVIDPLESGLGETFYYMLPEDLKGDLTQYDALLIAMSQRPKNFVLQKEGKWTAFDYLFCDTYRPELGNIIAFTDGVFDESLWQDRSWRFGYQFGIRLLNENRGMVRRGSTLEEVLQRRQDWLEKTAQVKHIDFQTETAQQLMDYLKPYENGVFVPEKRTWASWSIYWVGRYINGCPTNEWYKIDYETEEVEASEYRFEDADFEKLPDISSYIASLDLEKIAPQHMDPSGKTMVYNTAVGWYEKTENGVYSVVRIAWRYFDQDDSFVEYYDETFILLDETGDHIISREELIELIGENPNIYNKEYGVATGRPMY